MVRVIIPTRQMRRLVLEGKELAQSEQNTGILIGFLNLLHPDGLQ